MTATPRTIVAIRLGRRLVRLGAAAIFLGLSGVAPTHAQTPPIPLSGVEPALVEDIVVGSRILADFGVVDAFATSARGIPPIRTTF